jgi:hypothetical protein
MTMKTMMFAAVAGMLALGALGCEEEKKGPPPEPQFEVPGGSPLALTKALRGVELWPTATVVDGHGARLAAKSASAETLVVYEQLSSEYVMARTAVFADAKLENRLEDLFAEPKLADVMAGYSRKVFVVDPLRLDQSWIVDASRGTRGDAAERETFLNFGDAGYREDAATRIVSAIADAGVVPEAVVIGSEMERYYLLNRNDWANFASFYLEVRSAIKASFPSVQVAVGINWSNFMESVAPDFIIPEADAAGCAADAECGAGSYCAASQCGELDFVAVQAAWQAVIDPITFDAVTATPLTDFYAFASIPNGALYGGDPNALPDTHYAGIPTMFREEPARKLPVRWFRIGWDVSGDSETPVKFLNRFEALNGSGYDVALVSWFGFVRQLTGDCNVIRDTLRARPEVCQRGFFTSSGAPAGSLGDSYFAD